MKNLDAKLKELFGTEESPLSEETLVEMKVLISALIEEKIAKKDQEIKTLKEGFEAEKAELVSQSEENEKTIYNELSEKAEEYSKYVVDKFMEENKEKLIEGDEYNRMKNVFTKVKALFEDNFFSLNVDEAVSREIETLNEQIESQKQEFSELFEQFITLKDELENLQFANLFESETKDLPDTQRETISKLLEHITCKDLNEYKSAVNLLIEQVKSSKSKEVEPPKIEEKENSMSKYMNLL